MRSFNKLYTITEYGSFSRGTSLNGYSSLPERTFDALESFILTNKTGEGTDAIELLSISARRGVGKIITARNYVGLITMSDGISIEILPKIAKDSISVAETKKIFLEMLKTLKDVTFKDFNVSNVDTDRMSLLDIFIKMFINEVSVLTKQGLKSAYTTIENNERFYKGKLSVSQNLKYNLVNKERFFVEYDDFNINRPENRLIKSALAFILKSTGDNNNRQNTIRLLSFFDGIEFSKTYDSDFSKCFIDRSMNHYDKALSWCKVFLRGNSFTSYSGSEVAIALLFPMEKIFESYIAAKLRRIVPFSVELKTQDSRYSLFDSPTRAFGMRPDIVMIGDGSTVVMDTKWKLLSENTRNYGISQSDMYQMYAYSKKYDAKKVLLIYPLLKSLSNFNIAFESDDGVSVKVEFIDLQNIDDSISTLINI